MKIRIGDISPEGLIVSETLPLEPLNNRMNEGSKSDILFTSPPQVNLVVHRNSEGAEVTGRIKATCQQACARCAKDCSRQIENKIRFILKARLPGSEESEDDIGIIYFEGDSVELDAVLQEALILPLSLFWSPKENEEGACTLCGMNQGKFDNDIDVSQSMKDLLEKASKGKRKD